MGVERPPESIWRLSFFGGVDGTVINEVPYRLYMQEDLRNDFLALYDSYADVVFRLCLSKVSSREEAKDLTQETFVRVFERLSQKREKIQNLRAFLFTVARNLIKDHYKRKKPVLARDLPEGVMENIPISSDGEQTSEVRLALTALGKLAPQYRIALQLHLVEGYGVGEIAEMLGERPNTISVRIKRGLAKVREMLRT